MIALSEINKFSREYRVSAETIEKDYVISWILACISKSVLKENFIFYGGTAIKRVYFEDHRYSEDIDLLSTSKFSLNQILEAFDCLEYAKDKANLVLTINENNILATNNRVQLYVIYNGYDEIIGAPKEIRLDFSMDMELYGKNDEEKVIESYSDLKNQNSILSVFSLNTILANKLGLLFDITRNEPRDLFDIWFLLQRLDKFKFDFNKMCEAFNNKLSFTPSLSLLKPYLNNPSLKKNWDVRLSKQLAELPDINQVIQDITIKLEKLF